MSRFAHLFAASLLAQAFAHLPVANASIDPDVVDVRSAGYWEEGGISGSYRVVVRHYGFEEISSSITFEWLTEETRESPAHVIHSVVFADAFLGTAGIDSLMRTNGGVKVVLSGILHIGSAYHCELVLRPGGNMVKGHGC